MKQYPSISANVHSTTDVYVFQKFDGSNIRAEWSPKRGFYKFGSRKKLLGEDDPAFGEAIALIKKQNDTFTKIFKEKKIEGAICYFEFFGERSFAGFHYEEPHKVVLIDVDVYKNGMLTPVQFLNTFEGRVEIPKFLYYGKITPEIENQIRTGVFPGMTFEGVVCKTSPEKRWSLPLMFKIKNQAWIDKVREVHGNYADLEDLL